jgi:HAD superfamily hydrolase (TIGR01490 family)
VKLAIFDLDNTLINGDSDHSWGQYMVDKQMVDRDHYEAENDRFYQDYERGALDINAYLRFSLEPLTRYSDAELQALHQEFMDSVVAPMRLEKAEALLAKHRADGDFLLIITSTNGFITEPIAKALGVDAILATNAERKNGRYTGELDGVPCYQEGKVTRLNEWLKNWSGDLQGSYFYSDSINDLPLLEVVDKPVAVDPDDALRAIAESKSWPIISLR